MLPEVSVQIPTYNQVQYLKQAIDSVLMQDYPELELVIADDCSSDGTAALVQSYNDSRIRYFRNSSNIGRVANYRKALYEYCTGEWVVNLDGDDYYTDPSFISRAVKLISRYREAGHPVVFYQAAMTVRNDDTGEAVPKSHALLGGKEHGVFRDYFFGKFRANRFFSHLTTIYHRPTAMRIGFYEYDTLTTDFESLMKLSFYGDVVLDSNRAGVWRVHGKNATHGTGTAFHSGDQLVYQRIPVYAREAFGSRYEKEFRKKTVRESAILHLELMGDNSGFFPLLKQVTAYRTLYKRIPVLLAKTLLRRKK